MIGGSHGGWIGAHLTMRYPETFALMILMNPVTDLILDINVSDIPDWSMFESGHPFDFHSPSLSLTLKDLEALFPINPAVYFKVHDKFPKTKIILGYKDKRAPMPNGLRWHEFITGKGLDSKTFILPDTGHSLAGYEQEKATFVMLLNFLNEIN